VAALTLAVLSIAAASVGFTRTPATAGDTDRALAHANTLKTKYKRQRDDLQRRLTRRVLEARDLRQALRRRISLVGGSPLEKALLCIHSHEGSWTDPDAPFYGGLQMDRRFMETYGPEFLRAFGTADRWPVSVQIAVAIKACVSGRGWRPWPLTSRMCGLLP
jgi:hypothetical protein